MSVNGVSKIRFESYFQKVGIKKFYQLGSWKIDEKSLVLFLRQISNSYD